MGYRRQDGRVGVRNHVLVVPTQPGAAPSANRIALRKAGALSATLARWPGDAGAAQTVALLRSICGSPNVGAVLLVGIGREDPVRAEALAQAVRADGKPAAHLLLRDAGGGAAGVQLGGQLLSELTVAAAASQRQPCAPAHLLLGLAACSGGALQEAVRLLACGARPLRATGPETGLTSLVAAGCQLMITGASGQAAGAIVPVLRLGAAGDGDVDLPAASDPVDIAAAVLEVASGLSVHAELFGRRQFSIASPGNLSRRAKG